VVQFTYGDDGLHPDKMEDNDRPVDFHRLRLHVSQTSPCHDEVTLSGNEMMSRVDFELSKDRFTSLLPVGRVFLQEIRDYFETLAKEQTDLISNTGFVDNLEFRTWNSCRITSTQLEMMLKKLREKIDLAYVEPGEAVGAIGAQSISEPGTQMTLKVCG
jgi:DNA-directed RNA polymerase III subunit RPC1